MFEAIVGNDSIKKYLKHMVETNHVGHSLLFSGPDGVGKSLFAEELAKMILMQEERADLHLKKIASHNHPDIRHFRPEGKIGIHTIDAMRQFSEEVYLHPYESKRKIFIIHDADRMLSFSSNALLKTFEEPSNDTVIILLSSSPESLLPTVLSRCRHLRFQQVPQQDLALFLIEYHHVPTDEARRLAELSHGSVGKALQLLSNGGKDPLREKILQFLGQRAVTTYKELTEFIYEVCCFVDEEKKNSEQEIKEKLLKKSSLEDMSASQKQAFHKEVDGAIALKQTTFLHAILDTILTWYRDLHLLYLGGESRYLINKDYEPTMQELIVETEPYPLEEVQSMIKETRISLARSTSLSICLENLFLKLNFL